MNDGMQSSIVPGDQKTGVGATGAHLAASGVTNGAATGVASGATDGVASRAATGVASGATNAALQTSSIALPAGKSASALVGAASPGSSAYKIGPLDVLDISVFNVPELSKSVQVADSGTVNLPLVGDVPATGRTAQDVERDLTKQLGAKYLQSPQVTVFVKEYNSQRVTIEGAVKKPGVYPIKGKGSLLQYVATAEGPTEMADSDVLVFRDAGGKRTAAKFNLDDIRSGKADDPPIQQGDLIVLNTSGLKTVYQSVMKTLPAFGNFFAVLL